MIDNSYCSPLYQRPIELGIDLSAQTATKYIGGHSDVVAGVVTGKQELIKKIFDHEFMTIGPSLSPHSAWLLIRGLRTLPLRIKRSFESTKIITEWLQKHPLVDRVIWPFKEDWRNTNWVKSKWRAVAETCSVSEYERPGIGKDRNLLRFAAAYTDGGILGRAREFDHTIHRRASRK